MPACGPVAIQSRNRWIGASRFSRSLPLHGLQAPQPAYPTCLRMTEKLVFRVSSDNSLPTDHDLRNGSDHTDCQ